MLDIKGTLIFTGDYSNSSGGLTIEDGGTLIIDGNLTTGSALTINGTGRLKVMGNLTQTGGTINLSNSAMLVVGKNFTEGWQTANLYNNASILVVQNYYVNGNLTEHSSGNVVSVLGTVSGGGLPVYNNSIPSSDPDWFFYTGGVSNLWSGAADSNWTNTANWTAGYVPPSGANVEFNSTVTHQLVLDVDRIVGYLNITSGNQLHIPAGKCLTVNATITTTNDPNQIYIHAGSSLPNGSLIFHNAQNSPVQATVEMYSLASKVSGHYRWQFFGIPVQSLATASPTFDGGFVREMHENDSPLHWYQLNNASSLTAFHGYEITQTTGNTYVFKGALVNSDYNATLPYTSGVSYPGQSLIGNSYTSAIAIKKLAFGADMLATVYLYNTGSYVDWQNAGSGNPADSTYTLAGQYTAVPFALAGTGTLPGQIPSMQAFLVHAKKSSTNATLSIPYNTASAVVKNTD